ncbi:hypothetical protein CEXT_359281 [Caerostris extrusa]|uniref:Uncharacterized protein n=1 Tax=Caerostris extrusa TaxID=172846 RepID=A0AAV4QWD1_CAEEX|nr:hypothetical protein CEXT_359281 [Caerostris extrusa]
MEGQEDNLSDGPALQSLVIKWKTFHYDWPAGYMLRAIVFKFFSPLQLVALQERDVFIKLTLTVKIRTHYTHVVTGGKCEKIRSPDSSRACPNNLMEKI